MATAYDLAPPSPATPPEEGWFYGVLFRPAETFARADLADAMGHGLGAIALVAALVAVAAGPTAPTKVVLAMVIAMGWMGLAWIVLSGVAFFVASALTLNRPEPVGSGLGGLLAGTALAFLPLMFIAPLAAFAKWGVFGRTLAALGAVVLMGWWLRLVLAAVRGAMGVSGTRATMILVGTELLLAAVPGTYLSLWLLTIVLVAG